MSGSIDRPSARIYQFPLQSRVRRNAERTDASKALEIDGWRGAVANSGSWYHEEAIREAERAKKR